jgi:cobalamin biosynthetic protein CobC
VFFMLEHGGRLVAAAARYGIPASEWLDLSTGIAPFGYPLPAMPEHVWRRLPEDDSLEAIAAAYYGNPSLLAVAGSQAAIQALPMLFRSGSAALLAPTYGEHPAAWERAGHQVTRFAANDLETVCATADTVIVCNPNNPTAHRYAPTRLLDAAAILAARGGWLLVDEAFMDATPEHSVAAAAGGAAPNLVVLRSLGKFFGLAGARVGFVIGESTLLDRLRETLGPWAVAGPGRWAAKLALADAGWQARQRLQLNQTSLWLGSLLQAHGLEGASTALYHYVVTPRAATIHAACAQRGILLRQFDDPPALRFGLPGDETDWQRLAAALKEIA